MSNGQSFTSKFPFASVVSSLPGNYLFLLPDAPDFTIVDATDQYCAMTYLDKEDLIGKPIFRVFPEVIQPGKSEDTLRSSFMDVLRTRDTAGIPLHQYNIYNPSLGIEEERFWTFDNIPVLDEQGNLSLIIHSVSDKTIETTLRNSEKQALESLRTKDRFYKLLMQAPVAMCILEGKDMVISSANRMILKLWDLNEEVIGHSLFEVLPEFREFKNSHDIIRAYKTGEMVYGYEEPFNVSLDGEDRLIYLNYVCQPIVEENAGVTAVLVMVYDVTRQVLAARTVEESENKLRRLIEQSHCAISFMAGKDLIIELANEPAMKSMDSGPEIIGKSLLEILEEPYSSRMKAIAEDVLESGKTHQGYEVQWNNNPEDPSQERYYTYSMSPLRESDQDIAGTVIVATDVTEDVLIKRKLREGEERLHAATEAAQLGLWDYNFQTEEMTWDKRCRELYGLPKDAFVDYNVFVSRIHPDDREFVEEQLRIACTPESGGIYDVEHRTTSERERWVRSVGKIFFDEHDMPYRFIGTILDITDKKQEEIRKNDFTAMASHELKTPITSIKAYIQILTTIAKKFNDNFLSNSLVKVETQLNKMTKMINDFLDLSKMESGRFALNPERFELNDLIEEEIAEIKPLISTHTISFGRNMDTYLFADRQKIGEVIQNFLSNAAKYSPNSKLITVKVINEGNNVKVTVNDRGIGISQDDQEKVFRRFFRSERASQHGFSGFGIGLYIAAEIIQRHNGSIGVSSEEDVGSEFYFSLPITDD